MNCVMMQRHMDRLYLIANVKNHIHILFVSFNVLQMKLHWSSLFVTSIQTVARSNTNLVLFCIPWLLTLTYCLGSLKTINLVSSRNSKLIFLSVIEKIIFLCSVLRFNYNQRIDFIFGTFINSWYHFCHKTVKNSC